MSRRRRIGIAVGVVVVFLILMLPLSVALPLALPEQSGLSARRASGSIWSGVLHDARLAGMPLGDTRVGLSPFALFIGEARLAFESPSLRGTLLASPGSFGIAHGNGPVDVAVRVKPIPISQIVLDDASVRFSKDRCLSADGRARAVMAGDIGGLALPGGMTGALRCDGNALRIPLAGQSGMERIDFRVQPDGKWRAEIAVRTADPAVVAKLVAAGFAPGPGGFTLSLTGAL